MRKSVAIIGTRGYPSYYGGFETLVRVLAPYLVERNWDVVVYGRKGAVQHDDKSINTRVRSVETLGIESKSLSTLSYGFSSVLHSSVVKPDVALVMNVANGYWLPLLRARNVPTVVNVDGIEWERDKWGANARRVFKGGASMTAKFGDELVFDSMEIAKRWGEDFRRSGTYIAYGGVDPGPLDAVEGLVAGEYILIVARFVPENTVGEFLEAAAVLSRDFDIVIVGSSGYGGELDLAVQKLADSSSRVRWLGHVSDDAKLFSLWKNCGLYFHGHSVGGTNPALVQAMACGAPILARDTVFNREVLDDSAEFVEPDSGAIVAAATKLMKDPENRLAMGRASAVRGRSHYTWQQVCSEYENVLLATIAGKMSGVEF